MTLPNQQVWAIQNVEKFLFGLLDPKKTPGIPKRIRNEARLLLRHYPTRSESEAHWMDGRWRKGHAQGHDNVQAPSG